MRRGRRASSGRSRAILGEHNVISDISGFKYKASEMRMGVGLEKGLLMHWSEWSPENAQLHIKVEGDDMTVNNPRVRQPDKFVAIGVDGNYLFQDGAGYGFNDGYANPFTFN